MREDPPGDPAPRYEPDPLTITASPIRSASHGRVLTACWMEPAVEMASRCGAKLPSQPSLLAESPVLRWRKTRSEPPSASNTPCSRAANVNGAAKARAEPAMQMATRGAGLTSERLHTVEFLRLVERIASSQRWTIPHDSSSAVSRTPAAAVLRSSRCCPPVVGPKPLCAAAWTRGRASVVWLRLRIREASVSPIAVCGLPSRAGAGALRPWRVMEEPPRVRTGYCSDETLSTVLVHFAKSHVTTAHPFLARPLT
eukprot:5566962-Prymnesium_polylepis.1